MTARPAALGAGGRFELVRPLGSGAFGTVYRAFDRERRSTVALKVLDRLDPRALLRFKSEFRVASRLRHPNLVELYELVFDGERWFFTMELVEGSDLLGYVWRRDPRHGRADAGSEDRTADAVAGDETADAAEKFTKRAAYRDAPPFARYVDRLRGAASQLARSIEAFHDWGLVHRDVKPSNVVATPEGRVVLLDFGLAVTHEGEDGGARGEFAGTPPYMAPELESGAAGPASDWYAFGCVLYEALTGRPPFRGSPREMFAAKRAGRPPSPATLAAGLPSEIVALCLGLLDPDPRSRPVGVEVLAVLDDEPAHSFPRRTSGEVEVVGREAELARLDSLLDEVIAGRPAAAIVAGDSGSGKTALVTEFVRRARTRREGVVVLEGRCHERELLPFRALDGVVDALTDRLRVLAPASRADLLPPDAGEIARLFPVFADVARAEDAGARAADPKHSRRRATAALRSLVGRLAERSPLVVTIDDAQWSDADSRELLAAVFRGPGAPAVMVVAACRSEPAAVAPLAHALAGPGEGENDVPSIAVGPLDPESARELARRLLGEAGIGTGDRADVIARETAGVPIYVRELAEFWSSTGRAFSGDLASALVARADELTAPARRLAEALAVAGYPVALATLREAVGPFADETALLGALRTQRFVRTRTESGGETLEIYHDRVRAALVSALDERQERAYHRDFAAALERRGSGDAELLLEHWRGAGERDTAARYAVVAARRAADALAFERAAELYESAEALRDWSPTELRSLLEARGEALANGGRMFEAGQVLECAADLDLASDRRTLLTRAAEQYLRSGHLQIGKALTSRVWPGAGPVRPSSARLVVEFLKHRAGLKLDARLAGRGRSRETGAADVVGIDASWALACAMQLINPLEGAVLHSKHARLALRAPDAERRTRALAMEIAYEGISGRAGWRDRMRAAAGRAAEAASEAGTPYAAALVEMMCGIAWATAGYWREAERSLTSAEGVFERECRGVFWELNQLRVVRHLCYMMTGEYGALARSTTSLLAAADLRENFFARYAMGMHHAAFAMTAADRGDEALAAAENYARQAGDQSWNPQIEVSFVRVEVLLYLGRADEAVKIGKPLHRQFTFPASLAKPRMPFWFVESSRLYAAALLAASRRGRRLDLVDRAEQVVRGIEREGTEWGDANALLLRACAAANRGRDAEAERLFGQAESRLDAVGMGALSAGARWRRGELLGGSEGDALRSDAERWLRARDVVNPARLVTRLAPRG